MAVEEVEYSGAMAVIPAAVRCPSQGPRPMEMYELAAPDRERRLKN